MFRRAPSRSAVRPAPVRGPALRPGLGLTVTWCLLLVVGAASAASSSLRRCPAEPNIRTTVTETNTSSTFVNGTLTGANVTERAVNGTDRLIVCAENPAGARHECQRHRDCFHQLSKAFYCCRGPCHNKCLHYTELRPDRGQGKAGGESKNKPEKVSRPAEKVSRPAEKVSRPAEKLSRPAEKRERETIPSREGDCYVSEDDVDVPGGIYLKPGQDHYRSPAACEVFMCRESSRGLELSFSSCGVLIPSEGCTLVSNDTVNYPHCCPEIRC
ncbi:hypothetical protein FJT64_002101 [Amphibalanus amphitrite]|uniref:Single domain-containing protein n=1 Tax=Amphibalanus amphitrite TaxID=1232801 RepID=A0A6A4WNY4_AMPAM|nr:hypothetical protein FJT64_002101 [Amphibalanus amphitrite]